MRYALALTVLVLALPVHAAGAERRVELSVTSKGFEPSPIHVKKGQPLVLVVTRRTDRTCAKELVVPSMNLKAALPLDKPVELRLTPAKTGELKYGCAMGQMLSGVLLVE
jgi:plastocyanin domain-containing protein